MELRDVEEGKKIEMEGEMREGREEETVEDPVARG